VGIWFVQLLGVADGKATLTIGDGSGKTIDTFDLETATVKSFDIPASVDVTVNSNVTLDATPKDGSGRKLHSDGAVTWTVDQSSIARFFDNVRNVPTDEATGTHLQVRGVAPGKAVVHGVFKDAILNVPVNVH
jgi:hypothetical protein